MKHPSEPTGAVQARALQARALQAMGARRFGVVNWLGVGTLCRREIKRFLKVYLQTLVAPVATSGLFLAVFTLALAGRRASGLDMPYEQFLAPGVVMMSMIQNAFANTSSSVSVAKVQGNIIDTLTPPLSPAEIAFGLMIGGVARGVMVGAVSALTLFSIVGVGLAHPLWALFFAVCGSTLLALLGVAAGIWADKFDHIAAVTNFVVTPLSFLSGAFYSISRLPPEWEAVSRFNPFFYLIDGFRYGALGVSDADPLAGAGVLLTAIALLWLLCWRMLATGYKLKS